MRVIHLLRKYDPAEWGGTESAVQRLFEGLRRHGVTPVMYCPRIKPAPLAESRAATSSDGRPRGGASPGPGPQNGPLSPALSPSEGERGSYSVRRFRACVPIWGISRED